MRIDIFILGRLALGEILLIAIVPFSLQELPRMLRVPFFKQLIFCIFLWILGVVLSDFVNQSPFELFIRGAARPMICLLVLLSGHYLMSKDPRSVIYFFFGLLIAGILNFIKPADFRIDSDLIAPELVNVSYGILAFLLTPLIFGIATVGGYLLYRVSPLFSGLAQIIIGVSVSAMLSRTTAAVFVLSGFIIIITSYVPAVSYFFVRRGRIRPRAMVFLFVSVVVGFCAAYYIYAYFAGSGMMGERQYAKFISQTNTVFGNTPWGVLASGRHYTLAAILRIIENPFFGAGSWPYAGDTLIRTFEMLGFYGVSERLTDPFQREIGHSILFGIWAQNGPLVLPCMLMVVYASLRLMIHAAFGRDPLRALLLIYLISFIFTMFFNNFNSLARVQMMFFPLIYFFYIKRGLWETNFESVFSGIQNQLIQRK